MAPPDLAATADLLLATTAIDRLSLGVPVGAPWDAARAAEFDGQSLETWIRRNTTGGRAFLNLATAGLRPVFGAELREVSMLFALFLVAASGDEGTAGTFERNFSTRHGAQQDRIDGGTQAIALALARRLGRRVVRRSPVRRIVAGKGYVDVISDRYVNRARRVIVALPPVLAGRIQYEPAMPALRDGLTQRLPQGHIIKVQAVYDEPFWRGDGLNGASVSDVGPCNVTFDSSPRDGRPGALLGFVCGDEARRFARLPRVRAPACGAGKPGARVRRAGAVADRLCRAGLGGRALLARRPDRSACARRPDDLRPRAARARRAHPLGRQRDLDVLERLHGRRRALRRAGGARGARAAVSAPSGLPRGRPAGRLGGCCRPSTCRRSRCSRSC